MALMSTQNIARTGLSPVYTAVNASDTYLPDAQAFIHVKNAGASPDTVAISVLQGDPPGLVISDVSVAVTNAQERMIGPLPANFFADPVTGLGTVTHSFLTSVTAGLFKLQQP
jgi:hypothetical protein